MTLSAKVRYFETWISSIFFGNNLTSEKIITEYSRTSMARTPMALTTAVSNSFLCS